jgi:acyl carrier protein
MSSTLAEVRVFLAALPLKIEAPIGDDDPLISSGLLDSMMLFRLYQEVENRAGRQLNPLELNFEAQWDTIVSIAEFIDEIRDSP